MAQESNVINAIPEFTTDESSSGTPGQVETKQPTADEVVVPETETPAITPAEKPTDGQTPTDSEVTHTPVVESNQDAPPIVPAAAKPTDIQGMETYRASLLKDIAELRGQKRELAKQELARVNQTIDELKDLNPNDIAVIDRVIRAKGYMTKAETDQMFYKAVENEELNRFLEKYPEYKPENDPNDLNWSTLQKELGYYKMPSNPRQIIDILERAHKGIARVPSGPTAAAPARQAVQRRIAVASTGSGGSQRPPQNDGVAFDPETRVMLKNGGFSDLEINAMEKRRAS